MIKRAIILQRSRPRLGLKGGREEGRGGAQITVQTPSQQGKRSELRGPRGLREGAKTIWVNPHKTRTKKTISRGRSIDLQVKKLRFK